MLHRFRYLPSCDHTFPPGIATHLMDVLIELLHTWRHISTQHIDTTENNDTDMQEMEQQQQHVEQAREVVSLATQALKALEQLEPEPSIADVRSESRMTSRAT